jgi:hypothetical protein
MGGIGTRSAPDELVGRNREEPGQTGEFPVRNHALSAFKEVNLDVIEIQATLTQLFPELFLAPSMHLPSLAHLRAAQIEATWSAVLYLFFLLSHRSKPFWTQANGSLQRF